MQRPLRNSRATRQSAHRSTLRRAFSLIELMVVILIMGILAGMLLTAIRGAMNTARVAAVTVEFKNLEKAIADFRAKYGAEPPSGIILFEDHNDWAGTSPSAAAVNRSRALVRQIWPDFDFSIDRDINGDFDAGDTITLNGAESLVFFLGGVCATNIVDRSGGKITGTTTGGAVTSWEPLGFSANSENPLARGGARQGPFYEFQAGRLTNIDLLIAPDTEGAPEYLDSLPGQTKPILYASSYGGRGYRDADVRLVASPGADEFAYYYRRYTGTYPASLANFNAARPFSEKSFQLISPGVDGVYGPGGLLSGDMELLDPQQVRSFERDNITNFKGGTIN